MNKKDNDISVVIVGAVIAVIIAFFVGYSFGHNSSNTTEAPTASSSEEYTHTEDEYQEAVDCIKEANDKLDYISSSAGNVGDGDYYEDLVSALDEINGEADTVCTDIY
jgi:hypothetical protein